MIRLTYWKRRGRAEQIRLLLQELGVPYEDVYVERGSAELARMQQERVLWFGSVPMIEDGSFRLVQGPAILGYLGRRFGIAPEGLEAQARADAIVLGAEDLRIRYFGLFGEGGAEKQRAFVAGPWRTRWLPGFEFLLGQAGTGFLVGPSLTQADVAVWDVLDSTLTWVEGATLEGHPRLERFFADIRARPRIAAYLGSDRRLHG